MAKWSPRSWQSKTLIQQVRYPDDKERDEVISQLKTLPPLVTVLEIEGLKAQLASAAKGEAFLLQGGDCAESFADCNAHSIINKIRILLQISFILIHGLNKPIIRVGRIAGQYAKPRSSEQENVAGTKLPVYRGDLINSADPTLESRLPDPYRLLQGYQYSALTLNYIRALVSGGFADLFHPEYWNLDFAKDTPLQHEYQITMEKIHDALNFVKTIGAVTETMRRVDFYISHEALHLQYEQALTRQEKNHWYNLGTHFPWIGMRTATIDSAHVEYMRGIANPIAIKIGPEITKAWLVGLIEILNPQNEPGRLTLIHRFGHDRIADKLPALISVVQANGFNVLWSCDPMHGNTSITKEGYKTRSFDLILSELEQAVSIHRDNNSYLGGVHFELTGEDVTECLGGAKGITESDLKQAYKTLVDPRLNYEQSLEMATRLINLHN